MPTIQIRNLDEATYDVLRHRAAESGRSLQEYLRVTLTEMAARPTFAEVMADMRQGRDWSNAPSTEEIVSIIRGARDLPGT